MDYPTVIPMVAYADGPAAMDWLVARILSGIEGDEFSRKYRAEDLEGHRWMFLQRGVG